VKWVLVSSGSPSSEFLRESAKDVPFLLKYVCVNLSVRGRFLIWCHQPPSVRWTGCDGPMIGELTVLCCRLKKV
jgi:hypothetical protein